MKKHTFNIHAIHLLLFLLLCLNGLHAQKAIRSYAMSSPLKIDGTFEPESWATADSAIAFTQMEPYPGEESTERTVCHIGTFGNTLFVSFCCYQQTPPVAKNQNRDALSKNDDMVALILDTYHDKRSGFSFFTNPVGTQVDMKINDDGRNIDLNWDTEWKCETGIYSWGWCAEMEIPFGSIKFKKGLTSWGLNFGRIIRSNNETVYWSGKLSDDFRISQGGILEGILLPEPGFQLTLFPYFTLRRPTGQKIDFEAGGDVTLKLGSNISLNTAINPDFATVEADRQQINLTRYEINYPEKRLFFQEGNDMYNTRIKTFYSRRIENIDLGSRFTGKIGKTQFNILNVRSPGLKADDPTMFFTAARLKYDFLKSSTVGLTLVSKDLPGYFTRSVSLDYVMNLAKTWQLTGQFVGSFPGSFNQHSAWYLRFAKENTVYHYHIRITRIGEKFMENVNQTGFITDDNRREADSDITYKWWMKNKILNYIHFQSMNNIFWGIDGNLRSWYTTQSVNFYLKNKISLEYSYNNEFKLFEKEFHNHRHTVTAGYNMEEWSFATASYSAGRNFDRDMSLVAVEGQVKIMKDLSVSYSANLLKFQPDTTGSSTMINILTLNYQFNKDFWLRAFAQNSSNNDKIYLYGLLGWRFRPPFGSLYLIYSHNRFRSATGIADSDNLFLKLTYPLALTSFKRKNRQAMIR